MTDDPKLAEFRENNIKLTKQNEDLTKEVTDLKARLAAVDPKELDTLKTTLASRETELAAERAAHADTKKRAEVSTINQKIEDAFLKAGGRPEARRVIVAEAEGQFTLGTNGDLIGTKHSPDRPGEMMSLSEWLLLQTRANAFCFFSSAGGGARGSQGGGATSGARVLKNPSSSDLGKYATQIAKGEMKVEYDGYRPRVARVLRGGPA